MTLQEAIEVIRRHQLWRNGAYISAVESRELTQAMELVIGAAERHHDNLAAINKILESK